MTRNATVWTFSAAGALILAAIAGWYQYQAANFVVTSYAWVNAPTPWVTAPDAGEITAVDARVGDTVRAGQVVMVETTATGRTVRLTAPANGIVGAEPYANGSFVLPGASLFVVAEIQEANVLAEVPETLMASIARGDTVTVTLDGNPGTTVPGRIAQMGRSTLASTSPLLSLTPFSKAVQYIPIAIRLRPGADTGRLVVGETASVEVHI